MQKNVTIPQIDIQNVFQNINALQFTYFHAEKITLHKEWNTKLFPPGTQIQPVCRLYMPLQGEGYGVIGKTKLHFRKGFLYLIEPFADIHLSCDSFLEKNWIHFKAVLPDSKVDIFNRIEYPRQVPVENPEVFLHCFERLSILQDANPEWRLQPVSIDQFECRCALGTLITPFLRQAEKINKVPDRNKSRLTEIIYYIEHHLSEKLTLEELGAVFGFNANYLSNYFASELRISLGKYIRIRLILKAKDLLQNSSLSVKEISDILGFEDQRTFSRAFKRIVYMTPTRYRLLIRKHTSFVAGNTLRQDPFS